MKLLKFSWLLAAFPEKEMDTLKQTLPEGMPRCTLQKKGSHSDFTDMARIKTLDDLLMYVSQSEKLKS